MIPEGSGRNAHNHCQNQPETPSEKVVSSSTQTKDWTTVSHLSLPSHMFSTRSSGTGFTSISRMAVDTYYIGRFGYGQYYVEFAPQVLICKISRTNIVRAMCISMVRHKWFDMVIFLTILVNSLLMTIYDPVDEALGIESSANRLLASSDWLFQSIFSIEALIKITALGLLVKPSGYLRDGWNLLDLGIVLIGWIPLIFYAVADDSQVGSLPAGTFAILRFARILRPLRAIHIFPSLKNLVRAILSAASQILEVFLLCFVIMFIFALVGLTLFKGNLRQRCAMLDPTSGLWIIPVSELDSFCSMSPDSFGRRCPTGLECIFAGFNPSSGLISFDSFHMSLLTVFQAVTLEGWSTTMFGIFDTAHRIYGIYFLAVVLFGAYFMTNLLVSALSVNYTIARQQAEVENKFRNESGSIIDDLVKKQEEKLSTLRDFLALSSERQVQLMEMRLIYEYEKHRLDPQYNIVTQEMYAEYKGRVGNAEYNTWKKKFIRKKAKRRRELAKLEKTVSALTAQSQTQDSASQLLPHVKKLPSDLEDPSNHLLNLLSLHSDHRPRGPSENGGSAFCEVANHDDTEPASATSHGVASSLCDEHTEDHPTELTEDQPADLNDSKDQVDACSDDSSENSSTSAEKDKNRLKKTIIPVALTPQASKLQRFLYTKIVSTMAFSAFVLSLIFANTVLLALEHFNQPEGLTQTLEISNLVFLVIFSLEIILRLYVNGLRCYFFSMFNIFDVIIIAGGYIQLIVGGRSLSVLRALRILRFLRLANHWDTLNNLLEAILATILHIYPFLIFLAIILYILTISGQQFFGGTMQIPLMREDYQFVWAIDGTPVNSTLVPNENFDCTSEVGGFKRMTGNGTEVWFCPTRANYDNFLWSFVTTFQVVTSDNWNSVMTEAVDQTGSYWGVLYFCFVILFGSFVVLNFFLAILLDTFVRLHNDWKLNKSRSLTHSDGSVPHHSELGTHENAVLEDSTSSRPSSKPGTVQPSQPTHSDGSVPHHSELRTLGNPVQEDSTSPRQSSKPGTVQPSQPTEASPTRLQLTTQLRQTEEIESSESFLATPVNGSESFAILNRCSDSEESSPEDREVDESPESCNARNRPTLPRKKEASRRDANLQSILEKKSRKIFDLNKQEVSSLEPLQHSSLGCLPPQHWFRIKLGVILHSSRFDAFIILIILWSCVILALDSPVAPLVSQEALLIMNSIITIIFTMEATARIVVLGFAFHEGSYIRSGWNVLDLIIVISSIADMVLAYAGATSVHGMVVLRTFRALRPLRAVQKFEGLRVVVKSFAKALLPCFQVFMFCALFYVMFAIIFTSAFLGELHACYECDASNNACVRQVSQPARCMTYESYGVFCPAEKLCAGSAGNGTEWRWMNPSYGSLVSKDVYASPYSFDGFFTSLLLLFEISTVEIWTEPMYLVSDVTGVGLEPIRGSNNISSLAFVIFLFILQYFVLQIFVAVLINTYLDSSSEETGDAFMTSAQRQWVEFNQRALVRGYKSDPSLFAPIHPIRAFCFKIVTASRFKTAIYCVIIANTIWMTTEHYGASEKFLGLFKGLETVFGVLYLIEALLKILAFGMRGYFTVKANLFDFVIVLSVIVNWIFWALPGTEEMEILRAVEVLRVLRIFRLFKLNAGLKSLLSTLMLTMFPLLNISGLIFIVFFVYAILGMTFFGGIVDFERLDLNFLSVHVNFDTFPNAFYTLFIMSTGENWNGICRELSFFSTAAGVYCVSFIVAVMMIMMNLFVAVILTNYTAQFERNYRPDGVKRNVDNSSHSDYNKVWNDLRSSYIRDLRALVADRQEMLSASSSSENYASLYRAQKALDKAIGEPLYLPVDKFPDLVLRLKAPLGFRKRTFKSNIRFNASHVMALVKNQSIPIKDNQINFYSTLKALVDINVLHGNIPAEVETLLRSKLNGSFKEKLDSAMNASDGMSVAQVIAKERIEENIRGYILRWRVRNLKRHGASDTTIRSFLEEHAIQSVKSELERRWGRSSQHTTAQQQPTSSSEHLLEIV